MQCAHVLVHTKCPAFHSVEMFLPAPYLDEALDKPVTYADQKRADPLQNRVTAMALKIKYREASIA